MVDDYQIRKKLGLGGCGAAYLAENKTHGQVVLKFANEIWTDDYKDNRDETDKSENYRQMLREEVSMMQIFHHPHILKAYFLKEDGVVRRNGVPRQTRHLYSVNQVAEGGTLLYYLSGGRNLPEPIAKTLFIQLIDGLQEMHFKGIVHRDLKTENLLLTKDYSLLIADFGHATRLDANGMVTKDGVKTGTPCYNPPETHGEDGQQVLGVPLDLFMAGVVFFYMLSGKSPFNSEKGAVHTDLYYNLIKTGNPAGFWIRHALGNVSQETKDLISSLLNPEPLKRPSLQEIRGRQSLTQNVASEKVVRAEFEHRRKQAEKLHQEEVEKMIMDKSHKFVDMFQTHKGHHRGIITEECIESLLEKNINEVREFIVDISEKNNFMDQDDEDYIPDILSNNKLHYCPLGRDDLLKLLAIAAVNDNNVSVEDLKKSIVENEVTSFNLDHFQHGCRGQHG